MIDLVAGFAGVLLPVALFGSSARFAEEFRTGTTGSAVTRRAWVVGTLALYAVYFAGTAISKGALPFSGASGFLTLLGFYLFTIHAVVERLGGAKSLAVFATAPAFAAEAAAASLRAVAVHEDVARRGTLFAVHIVTIAGSAACLLLAGGCGILYLALERSMRRRTFGVLFGNLPDLAELGQTLRGTARVGFVLMTVGYNLGIWLAHDEKTTGFRYTDPTVLLTFAVWLLFGLIALPARARLLGGRASARAAAGGLLVIVGLIAMSAIPGLSFHRFTS